MRLAPVRTPETRNVLYYTFPMTILRRALRVRRPPEASPSDPPETRNVLYYTFR